MNTSFIVSFIVMLCIQLYLGNSNETFIKRYNSNVYADIIKHDYHIPSYHDMDAYFNDKRIEMLQEIMKQQQNTYININNYKYVYESKTIDIKDSHKPYVSKLDKIVMYL